MPRAFCPTCGDPLDTDPLAGNARPGDTHCDTCFVARRDAAEARANHDNATVMVAEELR